MREIGWFNDEPFGMTRVIRSRNIRRIGDTFLPQLDRRCEILASNMKFVKSTSLTLRLNTRVFMALKSRHIRKKMPLPKRAFSFRLELLRASVDLLLLRYLILVVLFRK